MTQKKTCNHILGYYETDGYDGAINTNFVAIDFYDLTDAKKLKGTDGYIYNFCPCCGKKLAGLIDKKMAKIQSQIETQKIKEQKEQEKREQLFKEKMLIVANETKMNQLPEYGSFMVLCEPTESSYGKDILFGGDKNHILRNMVHRLNKANPEKLIIKNVYKIFSPDEFEKVMLSNNWKKEQNMNGYFFKVEGNKKTQISLNSDGLIYINYYVTDPDDNDICKTYDQSTLYFLANKFNLVLSLEEFFLK